MILKEIKQLPNLNTIKNNQVLLKYLGSKEPNRGQELVYYSLMINSLDVTEEVFSEKEIVCDFKYGKTQLYKGDKSFSYLFVPHDGGYLINKNTFEKHKLKIYFREERITFSDSYVGNFFYQKSHLLINKRSLVITNLKEMTHQKIKFNKDFEIEWAFIINNSILRIIQSYKRDIIDFDIIKKEIVDNKKITLKENFERLLYKEQDSTHAYLEVIEKEEGLEKHYSRVYYSLTI
ncbi:hypothetical protein [Tenacibaculum maritimum]|uniref:hypothetical protein n=7 Tax=Tenacibaculum maritimum TaxID=107401 RepID=UPI0012E4C976|nr:hypothetical protein [Tenacibaculum maritimum]CAA0173316.1 conserved hypothetical protein [Tenacibaculum maritimum]